MGRDEREERSYQANSNIPVPREIYHPLVDLDTVANSVGVLIENIARDAVMRNKLMENDRVMRFVLALLPSSNNSPLLAQGLFCLVRLLEQVRDRPLQLAWRWFLKPLLAIMNDRGRFLPEGALAEAVLLFTQIVDTYFFDQDTSDEFHVEIKREFDNGINLQETVEVLLFHCAFPDEHVRFHAFFMVRYFAHSMGSIILENKLAVETLVGYLRNPVLFIQIKCVETLSYLQACKMDAEAEPDNFTVKHYDRLCKFEKISKSTLPPELVQKIRNSGHSHYLSIRRAFDAKKSLLQTCTPRDVAHVIARAIQLTPLSIVESDLLIYATAGIFNDNQPPNLDEAMCMVKDHLIHGEDKDALELAAIMMEQYPNVPYFYYAAAVSSLTDPDSSCEDTISFCDAGLALTSAKCVGERSYLRLELLHMAWGAFETLAHKDHDGFIRTKTQVDRMKSALKYAEEYIQFAAPDVPDLRGVIVEAIQLTLVVRNNSFFKDPTGLASWLDEMERKLRKADLIASYMEPEEGGEDHRKDPDFRSMRRAVVDLILKNKKAFIRWARRFRVEWKAREQDDLTVGGHCHGSGAGFRHGPRQGPDDNAQNHLSDPKRRADVVVFHCCWFCGNRGANLKKCLGCARARYCDANCQIRHWKEHKGQCGIEHAPDDVQSHHSDPKGWTTAVVFHFCSFCGNRSANLQKCTGCSRARYCDANCQKGHWKEHKGQCEWVN
ncbi:hypothetical protein HK102_000375 [Quaeritorhiza haematococci]|nr:hypothetical protein HK102_000375 [Quaeritorhiza haematococci]